MSQIGSLGGRRQNKLEDRSLGLLEKNKSFNKISFGRDRDQIIIVVEVANRDGSPGDRLNELLEARKVHWGGKSDSSGLSVQLDLQS
jgi:hypothetical protein